LLLKHDKYIGVCMRKRVYLWIMAFAALFLLYGCDNQTKQEQASQDAK